MIRRIRSKKNKKRVFVGVSGGVDSSVSAALLKDQDYAVVGVFIRTWQPDFLECNWREDRKDAMRVCAKLDIPFRELDLQEEYKRDVVDYMIDEYKRGRTPNPDVMCNKHIKFGAFLNWALKNGADYIATGHYTRIEHNDLSQKSQVPNSKSQTNSKSQIQNFKLKTKNYRLLTGFDPTKDQSYFLWTLTQDQLSKIIFPVGSYKKTEVRQLARKFDLSTADKKDSQGVCFLGKIDMKEFLSHYIPENKGDILDEAGDTIGWHPGAAFFTLGERHGFEISLKSTNESPYYVVDKDVDTNTLVVAHQPSIITASTKSTNKNLREIEIENVNWIADKPKTDKTYQARIRHLGRFYDCEVISLGKEKATIEFKESILASAGQSLVLYEDDICLGGGIIT